MPLNLNPVEQQLEEATVTAKLETQHQGLQSIFIQVLNNNSDVQSFGNRRGDRWGGRFHTLWYLQTTVWLVVGAGRCDSEAARKRGSEGRQV